MLGREPKVIGLAWGICSLAELLDLLLMNLSLLLKSQSAGAGELL